MHWIQCYANLNILTFKKPKTKKHTGAEAQRKWWGAYNCVLFHPICRPEPHCPGLSCAFCLCWRPLTAPEHAVLLPRRPFTCSHSGRRVYLGKHIQETPPCEIFAAAAGRESQRTCRVRRSGALGRRNPGFMRFLQLCLCIGGMVGTIFWFFF